MPAHMRFYQRSKPYTFPIGEEHLAVMIPCPSHHSQPFGARSYQLQLMIMMEYLHVSPMFTPPIHRIDRCIYIYIIDFTGFPCRTREHDEDSSVGKHTVARRISMIFLRFFLTQNLLHGPASAKWMLQPVMHALIEARSFRNAWTCRNLSSFTVRESVANVSG